MVCKNCNTKLNDSQNYCFECGAKVIKNRLTTKNLTEDFSEQFLSYDNRFLQTFIDLFIKPEAVISGYINGTRKKYINVVQYFAISLTLLGLQFLIINSINPEYLIPEESIMDEQLAKYYNKEGLEALNNYFKLINEYQSVIYAIGIPMSALITWIVFLKERLYNFTEHLVINMYLNY